jgi:hypothetical protein
VTELDPHSSVDAAMRALADEATDPSLTDAELDRLMASVSGPRLRMGPVVSGIAAAIVFGLTLFALPHAPPPPVQLAEITPAPPPRTVEVRMATGRSDLDIVWVLSDDFSIPEMLEVIATVDVPSPELEITVFLVEAGTGGRTDPNLKQALSDVWDDLAGLFSYEGYTELDRGLLRVTAGNHASQAIGGERGYTLEVRARQIDPDTGTFQLSVELSKRHTQPDGSTRNQRLVETTLEVKDGKTSVVGASRLNGDSGALITILQTTVIKGK